MFNDSLLDYITIYNKAIPDKVCNFILRKFETANWVKHKWSSYNQKVALGNQDTELSVTSVHPHGVLQLQPLLNECVEKYVERRPFQVNGFSNLRANRYDEGTNMKQHVDHIHTVFDGHKKGIPVLSIVFAVNEGYEGGDFVFFEDHRIKLSQGDVLIFPSIFLYPHRVDTVTNGTRYSIVQWVY